MARIGQSVPSGLAQQLAERRLKAGTVVLLDIRFEDGTQKEKFLILVGEDGEELYFVINSRPSRFIRARPALLKCQVKISAADHNFLDHDSHVDCSRVRRLPRARVIQAVAQDLSSIKGTISLTVREQIIAATKHAHTLSIAEQTLICQALEL